MPKYVDGFVIPVPEAKLPVYTQMARKAAKIWMEYGALDYMECVGDDLEVKDQAPFPKTIKAKPGEVVVFAWILFKSRAHRDSVNKKVMADPRLQAMCNPEDPPFDFKRMLYGGFKTIVEGK